MAGDVTRRVTYRGSAPYASMLAQMLEEEGVKVTWETRLTESRSAQDIAQSSCAQDIAQEDCGAMVDRMARHREWHKKLNDRLDEIATTADYAQQVACDVEDRLGPA